MKLQTTLLALAGLSVALVAGCDDGDTTATGGGGSGGTTKTQGGGGAGADGGGGSGGSTTATNPFPDVPKLGAQIDRKGRPAINTAGNSTFNNNPEQKDQNKDAYNAASDPSTWAAFVPEVQKNLAILDSLDTMCGNQLLADMTKTDPTRYAGLAGVLVDDRLYINTAGATCNNYLAVEADFLGIVNNDCGGRRMSYDVIDVSYTILASGKLDASIGDDVAISEAAKSETFPHMIDPN